jgi:pentatricopeptide repeat protein
MSVRIADILFLLACGAVARADSVALARTGMAARVLDLAIETSYDRSFALADSLADRGDPTFRMLKLVGIGLRDMDFETVVDSAQFEQTCEQALAEIDAMAQRGDSEAYASMLRGFVLAARSGRDVRQGKYASAVGTGRDALELMRQSVALDSTMADPDYFLGLYDFTMADLRKRLWWVLFWLPGDRARGIARLERCRSSSLFASNAATLSLLDAYVHDGQFERAKDVLDELLAHFPESRFVWWGQARFHEKREELREAAAVYGRLADSYLTEEYGGFNAAFCRFEQARLLQSVGENDAAIEACRRVVSLCAMGQEGKVCGDARKLLRRLESRGPG